MDKARTTAVSEPIKTLQDICSDIIIHHKKYDDVLFLLNFARNMGAVSLYNNSKRIVEDRFLLYLDRYGMDHLINVIGDEANAMHARYLESTAAISVIKRKGSVIERQSAPEAAVSSDGFFPLRCLVAGVAWPSGVDPTKREQYLSPEEFLVTFGITKDQFNQLYKLQRVELKKKYNLF